MPSISSHTYTVQVHLHPTPSHGSHAVPRRPTPSHAKSRQPLSFCPQNDEKLLTADRAVRRKKICGLHLPGHAVFFEIYTARLAARHTRRWRAHVCTYLRRFRTFACGPLSIFVHFAATSVTSVTGPEAWSHAFRQVPRRPTPSHAVPRHPTPSHGSLWSPSLQCAMRGMTKPRGLGRVTGAELRVTVFHLLHLTLFACRPNGAGCDPTTAVVR